MYHINEDSSIYVTRGDIVIFTVTAEEENGVPHIFQPDDVVRMNVFGKKDCSNLVLCKDVLVTEAIERVEFYLTEDDTRFGDVISKPVDYWYEIVLNPFTNPQTIIGYDDDGAKIFKLFPEGKDMISEVDEEDVSVMDDEFSLTSEKPLKNRVITAKFNEIEKTIQKNAEHIGTDGIVPITLKAFEKILATGTWTPNVTYTIIDAADDDYETDPLTISKEALDKANEALEKVNESSRTFTVIVTNDKWVDDETNGGYIYTVTVDGISVDDNPIADVVLGDDRDANILSLEAWEKITRIVTSENAVTLYANRSVPTTEFIVQLKVVR